MAVSLKKKTKEGEKNACPPLADGLASLLEDIIFCQRRRPDAMNWLKRMMYGRYGVDELSLFLLGLYLVLVLLSQLPHLALLSWLALAVILWDFFRILSRRFDRRLAENARFLSLAGPVIRWFKIRRTILRDREHRYFKCPNCGQYLRVPRGRGKINVVCRSCGVSFEEKS